jgi:ribonuclease P protein component
MRAGEDFQRTLRSRRPDQGSWFAVYTMGNGLNYPRLGLVVGTRAAPRAVDRNRVKRMVREAFRRAAQRFAGKDVVVRLKRLPGPSEWHGANLEIGRLLRVTA